MKIDAGASYLFASQRNHAATRTNPQDDASVLATRPTETPDTPIGAAESARPDFTNLTRQGMFDWMNSQIRSGEMSLDASSAFLGMTMKISAATGKPVDMASDTTRIDFTEKARQGIEFFQSRFDQASAKKLQDALHLMQRGKGVDIRI